MKKLVMYIFPIIAMMSISAFAVEPEFMPGLYIGYNNISGHKDDVGCSKLITKEFDNDGKFLSYMIKNTSEGGPPCLDEHWRWEAKECEDGVCKMYSMQDHDDYRVGDFMGTFIIQDEKHFVTIPGKKLVSTLENTARSSYKRAREWNQP